MRILIAAIFLIIAIVVCGRIVQVEFFSDANLSEEEKFCQDNPNSPICTGIDPDDGFNPAYDDPGDSNPDDPQRVANDACNAQRVPRGGTVTVNAGCLVSGDIAVYTSGGILRNLFDADSETGLVVYFEETTRVHFPYGGSIWAEGSALSQAKDELYRTGCVNSLGCDRVSDISWP